MGWAVSKSAGAAMPAICALNAMPLGTVTGESPVISKATWPVPPRPGAGR